MALAGLFRADRRSADRVSGSMSLFRSYVRFSSQAAPVLILRVVAACARRYGLTIMMAAALCAGAFTYAAQHVAIDTDAAKLISAEVPWRKRELALDAAFPQRTDLIAV